MNKSLRNTLVGIAAGIPAVTGIGITAANSERPVNQTYTEAERAEVYSKTVANLPSLVRYEIEFIDGSCIPNPADTNGEFFGDWFSDHTARNAGCDEPDEIIGSTCLSGSVYDTSETYEYTRHGGYRRREPQAALEPQVGNPSRVTVRSKVPEQPPLELLLTPTGVQAVDEPTRTIIEGYGACNDLPLVEQP